MGKKTMDASMVLQINRKMAFLGLLFFVAGGLFADEGAVTRRFGLFIGSNNGGRDRVMLRYAVSDAKSVSRVFAGMGGIAEEDNVLLVEPTVAEINRLIDNLGRLAAESRRNARRTELVFYYSGHSDENGILLNRERYGYRELRERINTVQADMRIVILDSCSSGAITRAKGGVKTQPFLFDSSVSAEGYAFLTSSSADETSQESDSIESSYFTHSILAGLRGAADSAGDGLVTLNELYRFAYTETLAKTETSVYGAQHPSYDIQVSGSGDVVLTDIKDISASLLLAGDLTGRISIRDSSGFLVAELTKASSKAMVLGLEPGLYRITLQRGDNFFRAEISLPENTQTRLDMNAFTMIAGTSGDDLRRGDDFDSDEEQSNNNIYSFFVNVVNEGFRFPLIGFVNIAKGNFSTTELGFVNWNTKNFNGFQGGLINTIGGNLNGIQVGLVNTSAGDIAGLQYGLVNTTMAFEGAQIGLVNAAAKGGHGLQLGLVNTSSKKLKGVQIGLINYADSVESGVPIGLISIVRHGGYRAIEYSYSEFFPFNLGFRIGVERFYSIIFAALNPFGEHTEERFAAGLGFGSIVPIYRSFFINPELHWCSAPWAIRELCTFALYFGYKFNKYFSVTLGPSVTWTQAYHDNDKFLKPLFSIWDYDINGNNSITVGARAGLRISF